MGRCFELRQDGGSSYRRRLLNLPTSGETEVAPNDCGAKLEGNAGILYNATTKDKLEKESQIAKSRKHTRDPP